MASGIKKSKAPKKEKEVTLEQVLWNCRVALRGFGSFEKNRDSVIGLAFLKFAGDKSKILNKIRFTLLTLRQDKKSTFLQK